MKTRIIIIVSVFVIIVLGISIYMNSTESEKIFYEEDIQELPIALKKQEDKSTDIQQKLTELLPNISVQDDNWKNGPYNEKLAEIFNNTEEGAVRYFTASLLLKDKDRFMSAFDVNVISEDLAGDNGISDETLDKVMNEITRNDSLKSLAIESKNRYYKTLSPDDVNIWTIQYTYLDNKQATIKLTFDTIVNIDRPELKMVVITTPPSNIVEQITQNLI